MRLGSSLCSMLAHSPLARLRHQQVLSASNPILPSNIDQMDNSHGFATAGGRHSTHGDQSCHALQCYASEARDSVAISGPTPAGLTVTGLNQPPLARSLDPWALGSSKNFEGPQGRLRVARELVLACNTGPASPRVQNKEFVVLPNCLITGRSSLGDQNFPSCLVTSGVSGLGVNDLTGFSLSPSVFGRQEGRLWLTLDAAPGTAEEIDPGDVLPNYMLWARLNRSILVQIGQHCSSRHS